MNELKVQIKQAIAALHEQGWSNRKIARELNLDRGTVSKHLALLKPAIPPTGPPTDAEPKPAISITGSEADLGSKPAISITGSAMAGRQSLCENWREQIEAAVAAGLSAQRIYQDLVAGHQFQGSYCSVQRFVRQMRDSEPLPFRRLECQPGEEAQVDFGQGAWVVENGKRRRPHLFRVVLSHSRKGYSEAVWRQTTENFIRCLENSYRHFGGVPRTTVIDNLRAAVSKADWFDPDLNPKVVSFAEHYGTVILPTKPAMPRHKGKVEAGIKYVQNNPLKGRQFDSLAAQNLFLADWERTVADTRIHGTTRTPGTQNRSLSALKGFFAFLTEENYLARHPFKDMRYAREPDTLPRNVLTPQESRKIMQQPDLTTVTGYRDRTMLEVLYATGIRKAELMNLTVENVNLEEGLLRINGGKGNKDRIVPLTRLACSFLENYIKGVRHELVGQQQTNRLFLSIRQRQMSKNTMAEAVEKYVKLAGIKKHVTCHTWRHTVATHLVQNKANLRHVQEIMGHRELTTTERYLHLTIADLKAAHHKHHPREADAK